MSIWKYLRSRSYFLLAPVICSFIFIVVLYCYGCKTEPVWYAAVIYLVLLGIAMIPDYVVQRRKYRQLLACDNEVSKCLRGIAPERDAVAEAYRELVLRMEDKQVAAANEHLKREKDSSDFYTMWVHQIKTPIAALRILLQTAPTNISGMKGELFKIEQYVEVVLNYLRMENLNGDLLWKRYCLEDMTKQAVKKYSPLFIQSKLSLQLDNLHFEVLTDEKWFVFVLEQLLSNAIKYTKKGGIRVCASQTETAEERITSLTVEDTGIGIYPEDLPRIFERSFTGYNGRNDKKATGLGLYLCKTILDRLGHGICITSVPGQGTVATVSFRENKRISGNLTKM